MISPEIIVFDTIADSLRLNYPGIYVSGEINFSPARFPAVSIVEQNNSVYQKMRDTNIENVSRLMYEVNIYSNVVGYGKFEAKSIMNDIDREFSQMGFTRTMCNPVENLQDGSIYRIVARYEAVATEHQTPDGNGGTDTVYHIYSD